MIKLVCECNNLEYVGQGYIQCGRNVVCPKKVNNKILGFDCLSYVDNLPDGCKLMPEEMKEKDPNSGRLLVLNINPAGNEKYKDKESVLKLVV